MAEDQLVNLEILQGYLQRLGVDKISNICINGQLAIDKCKALIDKALHESQLGTWDQKLQPISLCLLDF